MSTFGKKSNFTSNSYWMVSGTPFLISSLYEMKYFLIATYFFFRALCSVVTALGMEKLTFSISLISNYFEKQAMIKLKTIADYLTWRNTKQSVSNEYLYNSEKISKNIEYQNISNSTLLQR